MRLEGQASSCFPTIEGDRSRMASYVDFYGHKGLTWNWWSLRLLGLRSRSLLETLYHPKCSSVRPLTKPLVWKPADLQLGWHSRCWFLDQSNTQLQYVEQNIVCSKKCSNDWLYVRRVLLSVCSRRNWRVRPKALKSDVLILGSCVLLYLGWEAQTLPLRDADYRNPSNSSLMIREAGT